MSTGSIAYTQDGHFESVVNGWVISCTRGTPRWVSVTGPQVSSWQRTVDFTIDGDGDVAFDDTERPTYIPVDVMAEAIRVWRATS